MNKLILTLLLSSIAVLASGKPTAVPTPRCTTLYYRPDFYNHNSGGNNSSVQQHSSPDNNLKLQSVYSDISNAEKLLAVSDTAAAVDQFIKAYDCFDSMDPVVKNRKKDLKKSLIKRILSLPTSPDDNLRHKDFYISVIKGDNLNYINVMQETNGFVTRADRALSKSKSKKAAMAFSNAYDKLNEAIDFNNEILSCGERLDKLNIDGDVKDLINECTAKSEMLLSLKKYLDARISALPKSEKDS